MKKRTLVKRLVINGLLIALTFVLSRYVSVTAGSMKFTFSAVPIILGAYLYGPVDGLLIGFLGEFISQMLGYGFSATTLLWCLPALVRGLLLGLVAKHYRYDVPTAPSSVWIFISSMLVTVLNGAVIYLDAKIYHYYSFAYVFGATGWRFLASAITAVLYCAVIPVLTKALKKAKLA